MSYCANPQCPRPQERVSERGDYHMFSGYELYNVYHPECCPLAEDGTYCDHDHPEPMAPNEYREPRSREVYDADMNQAFKETK